MKFTMKSYKKNLRTLKEVYGSITATAIYFDVSRQAIYLALKKAPSLDNLREEIQKDLATLETD